MLIILPDKYSEEPTECKGICSPMLLVLRQSDPWSHHDCPVHQTPQRRDSCMGEPWRSTLQSQVEITVFSATSPHQVKILASWACNLVRINEWDEWKMIFSTTSGHCMYGVMLHGLSLAPAVFRCLINDPWEGPSMISWFTQRFREHVEGFI